jgi:hypothetical protein
MVHQNTIIKAGKRPWKKCPDSVLIVRLIMTQPDHGYLLCLALLPVVHKVGSVIHIYLKPVGRWEPHERGELMPGPFGKVV